MALLKMEPGLLERLPFLLCLGLRRFFPLALQRYPPLLSVPYSLPHYPFPLLHNLLSLFFLLSFPLSVPLSPFCVTGALLLSSLSGLALPPPSAPGPSHSGVLVMVRLGSELVL